MDTASSLDAVISSMRLVLVSSSGDVDFAPVAVETLTG